MTIYCATQKGPTKKENEDRILIGKHIISQGSFSLEMNYGILAVADGVGGNNGGAYASNFVATRVSQTENISLESFTAINEELLQISLKNPQYGKMATTLSGLNITENKTQLFNIGNSRVYILQASRYLRQMTKDDSVLNLYLDMGYLQQDDIENFQRKNEITACFGGGSNQLFKISITDIEPCRSAIIITSDGIHDFLTEDTMEDIIADNPPSIEACNLIISAARDAGSLDDASIIYVSV